MAGTANLHRYLAARRTIVVRNWLGVRRKYRAPYGDEKIKYDAAHELADMFADGITHRGILNSI